MGKNIETETDEKKTQVQNVLIVGAGFFALFMAFHTAQALQSSLNGTLGSVCLATLYGTFALTCVITPKFVNWLGPKLSMIIGAIPYVLMILSNLDPSYYLSVPANFLVGLGAPLLWTGEGVYLQRCAIAYASGKDGRHGDEATERAATSYLSGIFFLCYLGDGLAGLVLSSLILTYVGSDAKSILFVILSIIGIIGIVIFCFIRHVPAITVNTRGESEEGEDTTKPRVSLIQTLKLAFRDLKMTLMIPILYYAGMSIGFMLGDYTRYMISKSMGTSFNGYVVGTFYGVNAGLAYLFGHAAGTKIGRKGLVTIATIAHIGFYLFVILWQVPDNYDMGNDWAELATPDYSSTPYFLFLGAILFAIGDSVWESQPPAMLQNFFRDDTDGNAAMSNVKMWGSLGTTTQFVLGILLADYLDVKIYILSVVFVVAVVCLAILHFFVEPMDAESQQEKYKQLNGGRDSFDAGY